MITKLLILFHTGIIVVSVCLSSTTVNAQPTLKEDSFSIIKFLHSNKHKSYNAVSDTAIRYLKSNAGENNRKLVTQSLFIDDWNPKEEQSSNYLYIAIGTKACKNLLSFRLKLTHSKQNKKQALCSFIPQLTLARILVELNLSATSLNINAIFLDQPLERQLQFINYIFPDATRYGSFIHRENREQITQINSINSIKNNAHVSIFEYNSDNSNKSELKEFIRQNDLILALPDRQVLSPNFVKWLLYNSYFEKKPVIAFSSAFVNAGAIGSIYSTPEQIGSQVGEWISNALYHPNINPVNTSFTNRNSSTHGLMYPKYFTVKINNGVANSLNFNIPSVDSIKRHLLLEK